jgi:hypothetical protein
MTTATILELKETKKEYWALANYIINNHRTATQYSYDTLHALKSKINYLTNVCK